MYKQKPTAWCVCVGGWRCSKGQGSVSGAGNNQTHWDIRICCSSTLKPNFSSFSRNHHAIKNLSVTPPYHKSTGSFSSCKVESTIKTRPQNIRATQSHMCSVKLHILHIIRKHVSGNIICSRCVSWWCLRHKPFLRLIIDHWRGDVSVPGSKHSAQISQTYNPHIVTNLFTFVQQDECAASHTQNNRIFVLRTALIKSSWFLFFS